MCTVLRWVGTVADRPRASRDGATTARSRPTTDRYARPTPALSISGCGRPRRRGRPAWAHHGYSLAQWATSISAGPGAQMLVRRVMAQVGGDVGVDAQRRDGVQSSESPEPPHTATVRRSGPDHPRRAHPTSWQAARRATRAVNSRSVSGSASSPTRPEPRVSGERRQFEDVERGFLVRVGGPQRGEHRRPRSRRGDHLHPVLRDPGRARPPRRSSGSRRRRQELALPVTDQLHSR